MGWFDEQIRMRIKNDDEAFSEAFEKMAESVMGKKVFTVNGSGKKTQSCSAIKEVLNFYHIKPKESSADTDSIETQLELQLKPHGIMYRNITLRSNWYRDGIGILLGSTASGDIIALVPRATGGYYYRDPSTLKKIRVTKANEMNISREAICFYKPLPIRAMNIKDLFIYYMHSLTPADMLMVFLTTAVITAVGFLVPKINNLIFSDVVTSGNTVVLLASMILLAGVSATNILIGVIKNIYANRVGTKTDMALEAAIMMRILSLPADFFKKYSTGDIGSRMGAVSELCNIICSSVFSVGISSLFSLMYIGQIFRYTPKLVVPAISVTLSTLAVSIAASFVQMKISRQNMEYKAKERGLVHSLIAGVSKIKLAGAEKRVYAKWADSYTKSAAITYNPPAFIKYNSVIMLVISLTGTIVMYNAAVLSDVSVADYMAFNSSYSMVAGALSSVASIILSFARIKPVLELASPILDTAPETDADKKRIERLRGGIELNHISFRYSETMPLVIDDLSLKIMPGQYVAIVGSTGCGKSTLMRLMLGFEKPVKGEIYYDGTALSSIDLKSLRRRIGTVMQNGKLFQGDIFSNIVISAPQLTVQDAWEAAEMAGIAEDIRKMPMGMFTLISEGGGGISGGQRQRLMIARAIAPKPKILMFDEATSALDNTTQKLVSESLDRLKCTRIVIAHRLSTIKHCDRIIVLDKGKIIEDGTYEELVAQNGFFSSLVARQQLNTDSSTSAKATV
ncbi:MAG: NHLP bacteriocin export ABC transporter permease/ATPase subunit [Ruminococcus sp.]|nr:NHLP bacteriocin export ABC transporter permease/ATPase subunit [Ruminococcus sp.]